MAEAGQRPVLVFAYGNPSRGDDALGPALLERLDTGGGDLACVELLADFQLQIEHAMDLKDRDLVLFVDADVAAAPPFELRPVEPEAGVGYATHAMSPGALLAVYRRIEGPPPPAFVLGIRGYAFELGSPLSPGAEQNLSSACALLERLLASPEPGYWRESATTAD
ncbi:MAG: hydrogenase maturation protease [Chromatiales bacterium]|jgi:hydrogenase maturation protease